MKVLGIVLMWVGVVALLRNMGFIEVVDWSIIWPVLVIILGTLLKRGCRGKCFTGGCGSKCEKGGSCGTCEGGNCKH